VAPTSNETDAQKAEREAAEKAQQDKGTPAEQASISTTSDENGATKGYIGKDAADLIAEADTDDAKLSDPAVATALRTAVAAAPATYAEPVPPGGHPSDPTSSASVGAAAPGGTAEDGGTSTTADSE